MKQYRNKKETNKIGAHIRALRKEAGLSIDDISYMTGFAQSLLSAIENGTETGTSHLVEIAKAIGVHPMKIFDVPFVIKPRFKLSPKRATRSMITFRITKLYDETDFFNSSKFVKDVLEHFKDEYKIKVSSTSVAGVMRRFVSSGKLKYTKIGRQNSYYKKK